MKNFIPAAFAALFLFASCTKSLVDGNFDLGDTTVNTTTTYGDSISTVIITYGDSIFINNGTIFTMSDSAIWVNGNYTPITIGSIVFDNHTNNTFTWNGDIWIDQSQNWYYYDNSTHVFVLINFVNLSPGCGCATDTIIKVIQTTVHDTIVVTDTVAVIYDQTKVPVGLAGPEPQYVAQWACIGGTSLNGKSLLAEGRIFMRWGLGSDQNPTFGSVEDAPNGGYQSLSHMAGATVKFTVTGNGVTPLTAPLSDCAGNPGPLLGTDFQIHPTGNLPSEWTWTPGAWLSFDDDWSNGIIYIARTAGVIAACPQHHTLRGWVLLEPDELVYDWATQTWIKAQNVN